MNSSMLKMLFDMIGVNPDQIMAMAENFKKIGDEAVARLDRIENRLANIERNFARETSDVGSNSGTVAATDGFGQPVARYSEQRRIGEG